MFKISGIPRELPSSPSFLLLKLKRFLSLITVLKTMTTVRIWITLSLILPGEPNSTSVREFPGVPSHAENTDTLSTGSSTAVGEEVHTQPVRRATFIVLPSGTTLV